MKNAVINKDAVIAALRSVKPGFQKSYGLRRIGLFGSVARNAQKPTGDVDVISYRQTMNPYLKRRIDAEVVYV